MPHRLILKVTKFQLPPPKRLSTVVKNILGGGHQIGLRIGLWEVTKRNVIRATHINTSGSNN